MKMLTPRGARRLVVFPAGLTVAFCLNLVNLGIVFFLREERQATAGQIGIYTAIAWLSYAVGCQVMPQRFASRSAARTVMGSLCGLSFCMLLVLYVQPLPLLYVIAGVHGVCLSLFWPVVMAWATHKLEAAALNRAMGWFNLSWSTGMVAGPFVAGWLCDIHSVWSIAVAAILFSLLAGWIVVMTELQPQAREQRTGGERTSQVVDQPDLGTPLRFPSWLGVWATFVSVGMLMTVFPLVADEQMGLSRSFIGTLFLIRSLVTTLCFLWLARVSFWHHRGWPLLAAMAILTALHVWLVIAESKVVLSLLFCLIGLASAFTYNMSMFHGAAGSTNRTSRMAIHESLIGGGIVAGSFAGGWLAEHVGAVSAFYATAGLLLLTMLVQGVALIWMRKPLELARRRLAE